MKINLPEMKMLNTSVYPLKFASAENTGEEDGEGIDIELEKARAEVVRTREAALTALSKMKHVIDPYLVYNMFDIECAGMKDPNQVAAKMLEMMPGYYKTLATQDLSWPRRFLSQSGVKMFQPKDEAIEKVALDEAYRLIQQKYREN